MRSCVPLLLRVVQGFLIGAGGILPGVSGGVLAVVFGVYRPAMDVLAHPARELPRHWRLLLAVGVGAALGFFCGAGGLFVLFRRSESAAVALFLGLILGTLPSLWREAGAQGRTRACYAALALAFGAMLSLFLLLRFGTFPPLEGGFPGFLLAGCIIALGVVVPGFSASPALMAVGLFSPLLQAVSAFDLSALLPLSLGVLAVLAALSRFVNWLFRTRYAAASHAVFGVVLASLLSVVPTSFASPREALASVLCFLLGAAAAFCASSLRSRRRDGEARRRDADK